MAAPASAKSPRRCANSRKAPSFVRSTGIVTEVSDLILVEGRREEAHEQVVGPERTSAADAQDGDLGVEQQADRRHLGRRVRVREASTDRAPVPDLRVTHPDAAADSRGIDDRTKVIRSSRLIRVMAPMRSEPSERRHLSSW